MVLSFSPTIWASSTRTFIFMYFSIIICTLLLFQELLEKKYPHIDFLYGIVFFVAILSYLSAFI
jgi:hypothetical protein